LLLPHIVVLFAVRVLVTWPPTLASVSLSELFSAAGNVRTGGSFPAGFGYHYGADRVAGAVDIMNHSDQPQVVYVTTTVTWVPDSKAGMKPVRPVWMDENDCGDSAYAVPAGPSHKVWRWTSNVTGRVILAGGHVHDGGMRINLANETTGQSLCTSYASYGTNPAYQ